MNGSAEHLEKILRSTKVEKRLLKKSSEKPMRGPGQQKTVVGSSVKNQMKNVAPSFIRMLVRISRAI